MRVTRVRLRTDLVDNADTRLLAVCSVTLDEQLQIEYVRVLRATDGRYLVLMPQRQNRLGEFRDMVHPINQELRAHIHTAVMDALAGQRVLRSPDKALDDRSSV